MSTPNGIYFLWLDTGAEGFVLAGGLAIRFTASGRVDDIEFKYSPTYLRSKHAIPLCPIHAPLQSKAIEFSSSGKDLPGFIDDCIPDDWGKKVIAMRQRKRHLDIRTLLDNLDGAHIGALKVVSTDPLSPKKIEPERIKSIKLAEAKGIADAIWKGDLEAISNNADSLKLLLSSGSGVGGARPKLLVNHNNHEWIAKFNRSQDAFDNAGAEWASMELARLAGLEVPDVELHQIGERKCLIVRRFDVDKENARSHLLTINACLKDEHSLEDPYSGSYEDIADIIRKFSHQPKKDLSQLLGQALINSAINNTDDHLRNFSIIHTEKGWQLSPAYDLVPSDSVGSYHQITINRNPFWNGPERPDDVIKALKINKSEGIAVAEKVLQALESWPELLKAGGVDDFWIKKLSGRLISTSESTLDR